MDMSMLKQSITTLADNELQRGKTRYGNNHSRHEGYAVLREEYDEFEEEVDNFLISLANLWTQIKQDVKPTEVLGTLEKMRDRALNASAELVQVIAMVNKMGEYENYLMAVEEQKEKERK